MTLLVGLILPVVALVSVYLLTGRLRVYAMGRLVDVPNDRSSHVLPTPRGGGGAIVITVLLAALILAAIGSLQWRTAFGLIGAGALVAAVGFADDHTHMNPWWRLLAHFAAAAWAVAWLGGLPPLSILGSRVFPGWPGYVVGAIYVVWLLNLSNFMDGIDGIAAVEVITVSLGGAVLYLMETPANGHWMTPVVVAAATFGFLLWNWPPAKIFMGDVGSGFLGLVLAILSLEAGWVAPSLFLAWLILLGVFVVDATITLIRRVARGERFYEAHRSHAYQHAARRWRSHLPVTLATGIVTVCWLLPIAIVVALGALDGFLGLLIAYAPLVLAALWLRAGEPAG